MNVNVTYGSVSYPVSFTETGLPSGTDWSVTLATDPSSVTVTSSPTTIAFAPSMNGTYAYSIKPTAGYHQSNRTYSGTVTINGAPLWVNFTYSPFHYNVAFAESGLPAGTTWSVTVNGDTATGDTATLSPLSFSNGTYSYSVASVPGYKTTATGSFTVSGKSVTIDKTFTSTRYTVKFTESGLPSGTSWSVTLTPSGGTPATESSITTSLTFSEPNGSYVYSVSPVSGYHIKTGSYSGSLTVSGKSPATTALRWAVFDSTVKFTESTLKKGTKWSVTIGSTSKSTTGTSISFSLANGTYAFSVTASGYTESSGLVSPFVLSGTSLSVVVTFAKVSGSSSEGSASLDLSLPLSRLE